MSRLLTFRAGDDRLGIDLYLHEPYPAENHPVGWYEKAAREIQLCRPFAWAEEVGQRNTDSGR